METKASKMMRVVDENKVKKALAAKLEQRDFEFWPAIGLFTAFTAIPFAKQCCLWKSETFY